MIHSFVGSTRLQLFLGAPEELWKKGYEGRGLPCKAAIDLPKNKSLRVLGLPGVCVFVVFFCGGGGGGGVVVSLWFCFSGFFLPRKCQMLTRKKDLKKQNELENKNPDGLVRMRDTLFGSM